MKSNPFSVAPRGGLPAALTALVLLLSACASGSHRAPVEDRHAGATPRVAPPGAPATSATATGNVDTAAAKPPLPGAENAGKPGYYTVKPGDTMIRVGLENGQNWRDIARWNAIDNPNLIEVGQVLRVLPPLAEPAAMGARPVGAGGRVDSRPLNAASAPAGALPSSPPSPSSPSGAAVPAREVDGELNWMWPATGPVITAFDDIKSKGLALAGKAGDPVFAAADGRVVYAGAGLRGYGNLVIIKHNATYLTAYAHNQTLLVKDEQAVRRGQKIAEMGSSEADRVQLHFEIRREGKPVDPARLLPPR